jgi:hypothetical protein
MVDFTFVAYPWLAIVRALFVAVAAIIAASYLTEPERQKLMAIVIGGAGGAYLNGGFGFWEFLFSISVVVCAYKGLYSYSAIGAGWLLHAIWDILHHTTGQPMISFLPTSSLECAVTDMILAVWFFVGAPSMRAWPLKRVDESME